MPRLNLKDDSLESDPEPIDSESNPPAPPTLRDVDGSGRGGISPLLWIVLGIIVVAGVVFALNQLKIIHLWGPKAAAVSEALPEPDLPAPEETTPDAAMQQEGQEQIAPSTPIPETTQEPRITPPPVEKPAKTSAPKMTATSLPPTGTGNFAIQVSSWETQAKANEEAAKMTAAGYPAYVTEGTVEGETWYRVRVGRYATMADAQSALRQLSQVTETEPWIAQN
jgi:cell division septation protein DedD